MSGAAATGARAALPSVASRDLPAVTRAQMAEVDRLAIDEFGIGLPQMMEQAGSHLAEVVRLEVDGELRGRSVIVAVGPGNNGGGGLVAARHLANRGAVVRVILARPALRLADAARHQLATVLEMMVPCCVAFYDLPDEELRGALANADVVVDAILGYNVSGPPHGEVDRLIGHLVDSGRPVVSLDLPSGLDPDTGEAAGRAVTARAASLIGLEVREAHARLVTARERAAVAERAIAQAEESLRVVRLRYQGGLTTIVDLLSAEAAFTESRQRRLEALHDVNLGVAVWELALGRLDRATFR